MGRLGKPLPGIDGVDFVGIGIVNLCRKGKVGEDIVLARDARLCPFQAFPVQKSERPGARSAFRTERGMQADFLFVGNKIVQQTIVTGGAGAAVVDARNRQGGKSVESERLSEQTFKIIQGEVKFARFGVPQPEMLKGAGRVRGNTDFSAAFAGHSPAEQPVFPRSAIPAVRKGAGHGVEQDVGVISDIVGISVYVFVSAYRFAARPRFYFLQVFGREQRLCADVARFGNAVRIKSFSSRPVLPGERDGGIAGFRQRLPEEIPFAVQRGGDKQPEQREADGGQQYRADYPARATQPGKSQGKYRSHGRAAFSARPVGFAAGGAPRMEIFSHRIFSLIISMFIVHSVFGRSGRITARGSIRRAFSARRSKRAGRWRSPP